jgi:hypothetical protein
MGQDVVKLVVRSARKIIGDLRAIVVGGGHGDGKRLSPKSSQTRIGFSSRLNGGGLRVSVGCTKSVLAGMLSKNTTERFSHGAATATEAGMRRRARAQLRQHQAAPSRTGGFLEECRMLDVRMICRVYHAPVEVYRSRCYASVNALPLGSGPATRAIC